MKNRKLYYELYYCIMKNKKSAIHCGYTLINKKGCLLQHPYLPCIAYAIGFTISILIPKASIIR